MKRLHIAISTSDVEGSIEDYTKRLGCAPCSTVKDEYALWRTDSLNFSIRQDATCAPGELRHLGWEDPAADGFTEEKDVNDITWERFSAEQQADEINAVWPHANYVPD